MNTLASRNNFNSDNARDMHGKTETSDFNQPVKHKKVLYPNSLPRSSAGSTQDNQTMRDDKTPPELD